MIIQKVPEPLIRCYHCGIHITVVQLIKHRPMAICEKSAETRLRHRYLGMVDRCGEMEFILYGIEGDTLVEGVANSKCMGRPLNQT